MFLLGNFVYVTEHIYWQPKLEVMFMFLSVFSFTINEK